MAQSDGRVVYTVTATIGDESVAGEYIAWLLDGHLDGVLVGGAESAEVVRLDGAPIRVETRYLFPSVTAFEDYEQGAAVALRADGKARFGDSGKVSFERSVGRQITVSPR